MIEDNKIIDKYANNIDEKTKKTSVQNVVEILHNRILNSLNEK